MEIKVNSAGNLELDIKDLLQNIDDEQAESLIQALAWDSRMWNTLKEAIKNEHGAFSYNEGVAGVVDALLTEIDRQRNAARNADKAYWKIYHLMKDVAREHGIQLPSTEYTGLHFFHDPAREIAEKYRRYRSG